MPVRVRACGRLSASAYAACMDPVDYTHLPEPVRLEDTVAEVDTRPVPDPDGGIDPENLFAVRYGIV